MLHLIKRFVGACIFSGFVCASVAGASADALRMGSDISYAPLEFYGAGHAIEGFDVDLARALAAKMGSTLTISNHNFDDLLRAVADGQFDFSLSAFTDNRKREAKNDFIDYMIAGSGMLVPAGNPKRLFALSGLCGMTADVQTGTSQDVALAAQSKACTDIHLGAIKVRRYPSNDAAMADFALGKSDALLTDYPVIAYLARTQGGGTKYESAGRQFAVAPYGIAVAKSNPALRNALQKALVSVIADGTYDSLLKKWGLDQGALRSAPINAGTLFEK
jgi:polar amino acid transport system substrate-binding protein